jgi:Flp pilus assembly protein TadG
MKLTNFFRLDRRGAVAVWVAVAAPALMMTGGLGLEASAWAVAKARAVVAADAAANAGAVVYGTTTNAQTATTAAVNIAEVNGITGSASRTYTSASKTLTDGNAVAVVGPGVTSATRTAVTATVSIVVPNSFSALFNSNSAGQTITASSVAEVWSSAGSGSTGACILALDTAAQYAIKADNMGVLTASNCSIWANSNNASAMYLNSGTISGTTVGAVGGITKSNSGSNTFAPWPASAFSSAQTDPYAAMVMPTPASTTCHAAPITSWQSSTRQQTPGYYCGNTTFGGNGVADQFAPGIYYINNGSLTFNNATILPSPGVTFVMMGSSPGGISYTNYSNTITEMSAPLTGPTAGLLFWQACASSGTSPANTMAGGSSLSFSGGIYLPCGALNVSNNIRLNTASGTTMRVVAKTIYAAGSAQINAAAVSVPGAPQVALVQ